MRPFGEDKKIKGSGKWKVDYRIRTNNRKIPNWWEGLSGFVSRRKMKQDLNREIKSNIK
jgi:hypothetical protein